MEWAGQFGGWWLWERVALEIACAVVGDVVQERAVGGGGGGRGQRGWCCNRGGLAGRVLWRGCEGQADVGEAQEADVVGVAGPLAWPALCRARAARGGLVVVDVPAARPVPAERASRGERQDLAVHGLVFLGGGGRVVGRVVAGEVKKGAVELEG